MATAELSYRPIRQSPLTPKQNKVHRKNTPRKQTYQLSSTRTFSNVSRLSNKIAGIHVLKYCELKEF